MKDHKRKQNIKCDPKDRLHFFGIDDTPMTSEELLELAKSMPEEPINLQSEEFKK